MNYELPLYAGDDLDELVAKMDAILDEQFMREVDAALERLERRDDEVVSIEIAAPLAG